MAKMKQSKSHAKPADLDEIKKRVTKILTPEALPVPSVGVDFSLYFHKQPEVEPKVIEVKKVDPFLDIMKVNYCRISNL